MAVLFWTLIGLMTLIAMLIVVFPIRKKQKYLPAMLVIALPVIAMMLYWHLGSSQQLQHYWVLKREAKQAKIELSAVKNPAQIVDQLKSYLRLHPNSPKGWYLLGKLYFRQRRYSEALAATQTAHEQEPSNTQYTLAYAQASFFQQGRRLTPSILKMLKRTVAKEPHNVSAINLLAIHFYLRKEYKIAVQYWERLLPLFQVGSSDQKILLSMIARAQKRENNKQQ